MFPFVSKSTLESTAEGKQNINTVGNASENIVDVELYTNFVKRIDEVTRGIF